MQFLSIKRVPVILAVVLSAAGIACADDSRFSPDGALVDRAGRRVMVTTPFRRIISLYAAHTENLFALGLENEIIGVSRHETWPPQALEKPVFSYHDDPERFLAARPDLVLIRPMIDRAYPGLVSRLEQSGIQVVSLQPTSVAEMYIYWEMLGALTGRHDRAVGMRLSFQKALAAMRDLARPVKEKKRVYFEAIHDKMKTFAPRSMAVFVLEAVGGVNAAADARPVRATNIAFYGKERLLAKAGQIDVYLAQTGAMNRTSRALIVNEPGFQTIKAVKDGRVYLVDENLVCRPTPRLLAGMAVIGGLLYPEIYGDRAQRIIEEAGVSKHSF